jgi:DNA-binding MarR family transcriptional regulator
MVANRTKPAGIDVETEAAVVSRVMRPLYDMPAHLVRRLQQVTQSIFDSEARSFGITPAQYAILATIQLLPGREQREIAAAAGYDKVTTSQIIRKLAAMDLLRRDKGNRSRRGHSLHLTAAGTQKLLQIRPAIARVQKRLINRLPAEKRTLFLQLMSELTAVENSYRTSGRRK